MKSKLINFCGIIFALFLAYSGFILTEHILDSKTESFLSGESGVDRTREAAENVDIGKETQFLTSEELKQILKNMNGKDEYPHEPVEGQMSMEEAIKKGKEWIESLFEKNSLFSEYRRQGYQKIDAKLCIKNNSSDSSLNVLNSYWTLNFIKQDVKVALVLNSVTGQVLDANISYYMPIDSSDSSDYNYSETVSKEFLVSLLIDYILSFGFEENNIMLVGDDCIYEAVSGDNLFAVVVTGNMGVLERTMNSGKQLIKEQIYNWDYIHLYFTTENPKNILYEIVQS